MTDADLDKYVSRTRLGWRAAVLHRCPLGRQWTAYRWGDLDTVRAFARRLLAFPQSPTDRSDEALQDL